MYNKVAFDFAVVSSTPLYSVTCLHFPAKFSAYFNTKGT
jgi:hypothetical protein